MSIERLREAWRNRVKNKEDLLRRASLSVATAGAVIAGMGEYQGLKANAAMNKELSNLGDKVTATQVDELKQLNDSELNNASQSLVGQAILAGGLGAALGGIIAGKNKDKKPPEPLR